MIQGVPSTISMSSSPLKEAGQSSLNRTRAPESSRNHEYHVEFYTENNEMASDPPPSSPFAESTETAGDRENVSPSKAHLAVRSPIERDFVSSPLKMLKSRASPTFKEQTAQNGTDALRSPRKISSPEKRFPVKPSSPVKRTPSVEVNIDEVLRDNEGLTKAIQILEDEDSDTNANESMDDTLTSMRAGPEVEEGPSMDDTMASTFSTFSAVPDMTTFAKVGQTPSRYNPTMGPTPRRNLISTPATARRPAERSPSPTPRAPRPGNYKEEGNTTNLILDFTDQIQGFPGYSNQTPARQARHSPMKSMVDYPWASTPSANRNNMSNLLDFDIPPAPTPRSMPSITPRELETLKSSFLSEISSLKASLSGKEAEVNSLKTAVGDAEKRVGESMEKFREERDLKEQLVVEKEEWEKRGREMEAVLRNVKDEIVHGERERDELEGRLDECERRREAAEMMAQEAESKMAAMRAGKLPPSSPSSESRNGECVCGGKAVDLAVEKVSRELHTLYKDKHETKVAALKKSYEKRWDKKVKELEGQVEELSKENEDLKLGRDTTMTKVDPKSSLDVAHEMERQAEKDAKAKEMEAELEGLSQVIKSVKQDNADLRKMLDDERVEKGKLVAAVDEMIPLVAAFDDMLANMDNNPEALPSSTTPQKQSQPSSVESFRSSISRASGLRAPGSVSKVSAGESRIGRGGFGAPSSQSRSGSSQGSRPGSGLGSRSGIMSSIEKMGSYKGRAEQ